MTGIETWLPVKGYEASYEVSSGGRVRSLPRRGKTRGRVLKTVRDRGGYHYVTLSEEGRKKKLRVHQAVAEAFIGPRPPLLEVLHWNDDREDNRVENLRYGGKSENALDKVRNGKDPRSRRKHCPQGHEYSEENTRWSTRGDGRRFRMCKACHG